MPMVRRADTGPVPGESSNGKSKGAQALKPPGAIVEPDNDLMRRVASPPEKINITVAIKVLREEKPAILSSAAEGQHNQCPRTA
jgi:hypothetical protein